MLLLFALGGCEKQQPFETERAFYYWKSRLVLSNTEQQALKQLKISKLYVKFFDVEKAADGRGLWPVAQVKVDSSSIAAIEKLNIKIIPVVFITNESLKDQDSTGLNFLIENMIRLVKGISKDSKLTNYSEFQIDCDWTESTRSQYFYLLQKMKQQMNNSDLFNEKKILSATIRLHQVKYSSKTGIPPVDKGMLMCYNMGNLKNPATRNSILDTEELKKYLSGLNSYPLKLDVALPLFEWTVYFQNNVFKGIISNINTKQLTAKGQQEEPCFTFEKDTTIQTLFFKKGDVLRTESSNKEELERCIRFITQKLKNTQYTVSYYHLDEIILTKHPAHELENLYRLFHQ